ncbi:MAG: thiolase family protein, partial [Pseudomonadota bacterium]
MTKARASYDGVGLFSPVTVPYQKTSEHGAAWFIARALAQMLETSGVQKSEIDGLAVSSFSLAPDTVSSLAEHFGLTLRWAEQIPLGGASGPIAARRAARAIQAGDAHVIACIGADANRPGGFADLVGNFSTFSTDAVVPYGVAGPNAPFSLITQAYMDRTGATREDFGRLCVSQRTNAEAFEGALLRKPLTLDAYMDARPIAGPLHLFDCVMPCAGADGFLVASEERAAEAGAPFARILAGGEAHNAFPDDPIQERSGWSLFADELFADAGLTAADMDFLQTYDDYPVIVFLQMEAYGFCRPGEAAAFVAETALTYDGGGLPHNTSGGQLSCGQAGAAGGYLGMAEGVRQICGAAGARQIGDARRGLVSGYGMVNYDRGLCSSGVILEG